MLTHENYRSPENEREYMSVSQYKGWLSCPARQWVKLNGQYAEAVKAGFLAEENKEHFLIGSYVDVALLTPDQLPAWYEAHKSELELKKGGLNEAARTAKRCIERAERDPLFMGSINGQNQAIFEAVIGGIRWKCMIDSLGDGTFTDLKTAKDFSTAWDEKQKKKVQFWELYGYDTQLAVYQEAIRQTTGGKFYPHIAAISKQTPSRLAIWWFENQNRLDEKLGSVIGQIDTVQSWKESATIPAGCGECEWCSLSETRVFTV